MAITGRFTAGFIMDYTPQIYNTILNIAAKGMLNGILFEVDAPTTLGRITIDGGTAMAFNIPSSIDTVGMDFYRKLNLPFTTFLKIELQSKAAGNGFYAYNIKYILEVNF